MSDTPALPTGEPDLRAQLRAFALSFPEAYEDYPWGEVVAKVHKKVLIFLGGDDPGLGLRFSVKLPASGTDVLALPFAAPMGYGLGKAGWVTVTFEPGEQPPLDMLHAWVTESYRAVAPKRLLGKPGQTAPAGRQGGDPMADQTNDVTRSDLPTGLGSPATRALSAAGLTRLEQLTTITEADLLQLHGMGPKALGLIRSALTARGLAFAAPHEPRAASLTFHASIELHGKTATGITVPAEVVRALGAGKRPAVRVTINGYTYRSTVAAYREALMLPLSAEHREAAGVSAGDQVAVTLELDQEPRDVTVPDDLAAALAAHPGAAAAFDALSYTERKEAVRQVESAKAPATRERRIAGIVTRLRTG